MLKELWKGSRSRRFISMISSSTCQLWNSQLRLIHQTYKVVSFILTCSFLITLPPITMSTSTKPLVLYIVPTPNGVPISILLEDLKAINPIVDYEWACRAHHTKKNLDWFQVVSVEKVNFKANAQKVHIITYIGNVQDCDTETRCFFTRNLGSSRWILTVESPFLQTALVEILTFSNHLPFCYILHSTTTKVTHSGLMLRRIQTITAKCCSGSFSLYVLLGTSS